MKVLVTLLIKSSPKVHNKLNECLFALKKTGVKFVIK